MFDRTTCFRHLLLLLLLLLAAAATATAAAAAAAVSSAAATFAAAAAAATALLLLVGPARCFFLPPNSLTKAIYDGCCTELSETFRVRILTKREKKARDSKMCCCCRCCLFCCGWCPTRIRFENEAMPTGGITREVFF